MPYPLGRFVYQQGTSHKFWECLDEGRGTFLTRWGRVGTEGQSKSGVSAGTAQEKIDEKRGKGYVHQRDSPTHVATHAIVRLEAAIPPAPLPAPPRRRM